MVQGNQKGPEDKDQHSERCFTVTLFAILWASLAMLIRNETSKLWGSWRKRRQHHFSSLHDSEIRKEFDKPLR
ncbi:uncharacterized protein BDR25DRAFT_356556 [Lindgomyces ingoldianus]|uniref:Uncharacterized protein n=1 Tax=Lindgomyces ingoldianus TaxID=673940 RepID=A0ACB6QQX3_9PLEO|nr:uncharacterized protein BDR25DRAFT_356556 [Lindgomyces ingoldianus]KAF2469316.1 hypothetical protein BDR25DRAFT_356556 [Lindgomyces ingoldianus]